MRKRIALIISLILIAGIITAAVASAESNNVDDLLQQASMKLQQGDVDGAIALYTQVTSIDPENYTAYHYLGIVYFAQKKYPQAIAALQNAQRIDPLKGEDAYWLGMAYLATDSIEMAISKFNRALQFDFKDPAVYQALVAANLRAGKNAEAVKAAETGLNQNPENRQLLMLAGTLYTQNGDDDKAIGAFQKVIKINPKEVGAYSALVSIYLKTGKTSEAENVVLKGLERYPDDVNLWMLAGSLYSQTGKTDKAIDAFEKVIKFDTKAIGAYYQLGTLYSMVDRYEDAAVVLKKGIDVAPKYVQGYILLSSVYFELNKMDDAVLAARKAVDMAPKSSDALANLGFLYAERNERLKEALDLCTQAANIEGDKVGSSFLDSLGWVQFKNGNVKAALATLEKAAKVDPNDGWVKYHQAAIYLQTKQRDKAVQYYKLAEKCPTHSRRLKASLAQMHKKLGL